MLRIGLWEITANYFQSLGLQTTTVLSLCRQRLELMGNYSTGPETSKYWTHSYEVVNNSLTVHHMESLTPAAQMPGSPESHTANSDTN